MSIGSTCRFFKESIESWISFLLKYIQPELAYWAIKYHIIYQKFVLLRHMKC